MISNFEILLVSISLQYPLREKLFNISYTAVLGIFAFAAISEAPNVPPFKEQERLSIRSL